jgi:hypothetical protein
MRQADEDQPYDSEFSEFSDYVLRVRAAGGADGWVLLPGDRTTKPEQRAIARLAALEAEPLDRTGLPDLAFGRLQSPQQGQACLDVNDPTKFDTDLYRLEIRNAGDAATPRRISVLEHTGNRTASYDMVLLRGLEPGESTVLEQPSDRNTDITLDPRGQIPEANERNNHLLLRDSGLRCLPTSQ